MHKFTYGALAPAKIFWAEQGKYVVTVFSLIEVIDVVYFWLEANFCRIDPGRNLLPSLNRAGLIRKKLHLGTDLVQLQIRLEIHSI
jgi:hypothetical protein